MTGIVRSCFCIHPCDWFDSFKGGIQENLLFSSGFEIFLITVSMQVSLKINKIKQEAKMLIPKTETSVQRLAAFVDMTVAAKQAIQVSHLYQHQHLQAKTGATSKIIGRSEYQMVEISPKAKQGLIWWAQEAQTINIDQNMTLLWIHQ